jgi:hypothetical protein
MMKSVTICPFDIELHTLDQNHVRREQIRLTKVGWKYEKLWQGALDITYMNTLRKHIKIQLEE